MPCMNCYRKLYLAGMETDMKRVLTGVKTALCICAVLGWWGVLYPELVLTAETYRVCDDNGQERQDIQAEPDIREGQNPPTGQDIYWNLLKADRSEIRFRSRLFAEWNKFMEAFNESDENGTAP